MLQHQLCLLIQFQKIFKVSDKHSKSILTSYIEFFRRYCWIIAINTRAIITTTTITTTITIIIVTVSINRWALWEKENSTTTSPQSETIKIFKKTKKAPSPPTTKTNNLPSPAYHGCVTLNNLTSSSTSTPVPPPWKINKVSLLRTYLTSINNIETQSMEQDVQLASGEKENEKKKLFSDIDIDLFSDIELHWKKNSFVIIISLIRCSFCV